MTHEVFKHQMSPFDQSRRVEKVFLSTDPRYKGICKGLSIHWILDHMANPLNLSSQRINHLREAFNRAGELQLKGIELVAERQKKLQDEIKAEAGRRMELFNKGELPKGEPRFFPFVAKLPQFQQSEEDKQNAMLEDTKTLLKSVGLRAAKICRYSNDFGEIARMLDEYARAGKRQYFLISIQHQTPLSAALSAHAWSGYLGGDGLRLFDPIRGEFWCAAGTPLLHLLHDEYRSHHVIKEASMVIVKKAV